jgi:uncharacterized surface protein with fasciclin (FAS1) repeats
MRIALPGILKYHVIAGEWNAETVIKAINENKNAYNVTTLAGENIILSLKGGKVMIKDAKKNMATVTNLISMLQMDSPELTQC